MAEENAPHPHPDTGVDTKDETKKLTFEQWLSLCDQTEDPELRAVLELHFQEREKKRQRKETDADYSTGLPRSWHNADGNYERATVNAAQDSNKLMTGHSGDHDSNAEFRWLFAHTSSGHEAAKAKGKEEVYLLNARWYFKEPNLGFSPGKGCSKTPLVYSTEMQTLPDDQLYVAPTTPTLQLCRDADVDPRLVKDGPIPDEETIKYWDSRHEALDLRLGRVPLVRSTDASSCLNGKNVQRAEALQRLASFLEASQRLRFCDTLRKSLSVTRDKVTGVAPSGSFAFVREYPSLHNFLLRWKNQQLEEKNRYRDKAAAILKVEDAPLELIDKVNKVPSERAETQELQEPCEKDTASELEPAELHQKSAAPEFKEDFA